MSASQLGLPQQTSATEHGPPHIHPPKVELFDLDAGTNTDPKGFVRVVDEYRVEPFGLYLARAVVGHPTLRYLESLLLPELGVRISDWWFHPGAERDQDFYLDIVEITSSGPVWRTVDHYLDVVVRTGRDARVLDTDELIAATLAGHLTAPVAERALATTYQVIDGLAHTDYDVTGWLAELGMSVRWRRRSG